MAYFEELPNISQPSLLSGSNRVEDRVIVKNLFKRSKLRTDVDQAITVFNTITLKISKDQMFLLKNFMVTQN